MWTTFERQKEKELLGLKDMERIMRHRVRKHAAVPPRTPVELKTFEVRVYWGGPDADEVDKTHTDTVVSPDGKQDERGVVSVVFVSQGGFNESGYGVRIHGDRIQRREISSLWREETRVSRTMWRFTAIRSGRDGKAG